jgi:hypothetical protein
VDFFTEKHNVPLYLRNEIVILCDASVLIATIQTANGSFSSPSLPNSAYDFLS